MWHLICVCTVGLNNILFKYNLYIHINDTANTGLDNKHNAYICHFLEVLWKSQSCLPMTFLQVAGKKRFMERITPIGATSFRYG